MTSLDLDRERRLKQAMLRRASLCFALSLLLFAPGCNKKGGEGEGDGKAADAGEKAADPGKTEQPVTPAVTPDPVTPPAADEGGAVAADSGAKAGSGGSAGGGSGGGGSATPREDLTCDPLEDGACLEGEQCIGAQGCGKVWKCDADIVCKKGVREYCGCDGRTFEAVYGNCPWKKYKYPGPCK